LVWILDHISSTVDQLSAGLFLYIGIGPTIPLISVGSMSPLMLACALVPVSSVTLLQDCN